MALPTPKPLSPQGHRRFDRFVAFPGLLATAAWLRRRDPAAAALFLMAGAGEGAAMLTTRYPPPVAAGWLTFRQHVQLANVHAGFIAAGVGPRVRRSTRRAASRPRRASSRP